MPLKINDMLKGRYRIEGFLGRGGFGAVYRAWDTALNVPVAVKENTADNSPKSKQQFEREAHLLARLSHPNLPRVTNHFTIPGQGQYLVMDLIEGRSLEDIIYNLGRPLLDSELIPWIRQVCDALIYLHKQTPPIIHRDIKPQNIIITEKEGKAVLVDFGIAKEYDPHKSTTIGARAFSPGYSPPEQYGKKGSTSVRSDVYSLGATLYALLTNGRPPPSAIERMSGDAEIVLPRQLNKNINGRTEKIILKSLELTTQKRHQSIEDFYTELAHAVGTEPNIGERDSRSRLKLGVRTMVITAILLAILGAGSWFVFRGQGNSSSTSSTVPAIDQAIIEVDGRVIDTSNDLREVACDTSSRVEIILLDNNQSPMRPDNLVYNWRFEPEDSNNKDKLNSSNYAIIYEAPCELDNQTIFMEVQKDGKTLLTKSLLFDITNQ